MRCHQRGWPATASAQEPGDIVDAVNLDVGQTNRPHALCHIRRAFCFFKRGGRNTTQMRGFVEHLVQTIG